MLDVLAIVFSPRRIEQSLISHEELGFKTAFICGMTEHGAHFQAWILAHEVPAEVYLLSYDDQVVTREQADCVLALQKQTGDVVSAWQVLGQNSPFSCSVRPSWGRWNMHSVPPNSECFYTAEEIRASQDELIPTYHFPYGLTAFPREAMLPTPLRCFPQVVDGLTTWKSRDGKPFDKGMAGDWCHSQDLMQAGWKLWTARDAEMNHLAPVHAVPFWPFTTHIDEPGIFWDRRPR